MGKLEKVTQSGQATITIMQNVNWSNYFEL